MSPRLDFSDGAVNSFFGFPIVLQSDLEARLAGLAEIEAIRSLGLTAALALVPKQHEFAFSLEDESWLEVSVVSSFDSENGILIVLALGYRIVDKSS